MVNAIYTKRKFEDCDGNIVLYFKKDAALKNLHYGAQIVFKKPLQEIKNSGNPGGFDYKRYSLFHGITHQVNLSSKDFEVLSSENKHRFQYFIFNCRSWVVSTLQKYIQGEKNRGLPKHC